MPRACHGEEDEGLYSLLLFGSLYQSNLVSLYTMYLPTFLGTYTSHMAQEILKTTTKWNVTGKDWFDRL